MTRNKFKKIFIKTIPIMTGYLVLGMSFGIYASNAGISFIYSFLMSLLVYAGSMQFVLVDLIINKAGLITTALTTLMVNARHFFYGLSMVDKYNDAGKKKAYMMFSLTDETYSLVCNDIPEGIEKRDYYFYVSLLNQIYWITGSIVGSLLGSIIPFDTSGVEFSMTALFITVVVEQWRSVKDHRPTIYGIICSVFALLIFGKDNFLIPSIILIIICLLTQRRFNHV